MSPASPFALIQMAMLMPTLASYAWWLEVTKYVNPWVPILRQV